MSTGSLRSGSLETKSPAGRVSTFPPGPGSVEPVTPPSKAGRRSFWDMLSKTECGDLGSPKTTDDIVLDRPEDTRGRRRHKTESVRTPGGTERAPGPDSGAQRHRCVCVLGGDHGTCAGKSQEGGVGLYKPTHAWIGVRVLLLLYLQAPDYAARGGRGGDPAALVCSCCAALDGVYGSDW